MLEYQRATSKVHDKMHPDTNDASLSPRLLPPVFSPSSTADYLYSPLRASLATLKRSNRCLPALLSLDRPFPPSLRSPPLAATIQVATTDTMSPESPDGSVDDTDEIVKQGSLSYLVMPKLIASPQCKSGEG